MKLTDVTQGQDQKKKQNLWIPLTHSLNSRLRQGSQRENGSLFKNAVKAKTAQNMCEILSLLFTVIHVVVPRIIPGKWKEFNKYLFNK